MSKQFDPSSLIQRVKAAVKQDPNKAWTLGALLFVLLVLVVRMALTGETQPARAAGAMAPTAGTSAGISAGDANQRNITGRSDSSDQLSMRTTRPHNSAQQMREWMNEPIKPITRNLFAVKLEYFPADGSRAALGNKTASDGAFWGRLEKSLMLQADQRDKRENLLANFRTEAGKLRLDSIMWGAQPKAMIDGKLVAEGDVVASFRVLKIEQRRIIVEREGIKLEIQMK